MSHKLLGQTLGKAEWRAMFWYGSRHRFRNMLDAGHLQVSKIGTLIPLDEAPHHYRYDLLRLFLDHGADIDACNNRVDSILQMAVHQGFIPNVQIPLDKGANATTARRCCQIFGAYLNILQIVVEMKGVIEAESGTNPDANSFRAIWTVPKGDPSL